jgi:toxin ParE1/3/4
LEAIYDDIAEFDDPVNADHVLDRLMATAEPLTIMPERGSYPRELLGLGIKDCR